MLAFICLILGIFIGYTMCRAQYRTSKTPVKTLYHYQTPLTQQQRLYLKSFHQSDSDRIRELNLLSANQNIFLRLLKQTFSADEFRLNSNVSSY